jgi:hypothetical protein
MGVKPEVLTSWKEHRLEMFENMVRREHPDPRSMK